MTEESKIDALLIRYAGNRSPNEIAEMTGIEPGDVARRTAELLDRVDYLSVAQKRAKLIIQLEGIIAEVEGRAVESSDRNLAGLLNASRGAIATVLKEIREIENASKGDDSASMDAYTRRFVEIIGRSMDRAIGELTARFPAVDGVEITALVREKVLEVSREYEE